MGQRLQENLLNQVNAPFTGAGTLKLFTHVIVAACNKLGFATAISFHYSLMFASKVRRIPLDGAK